MPLGVVVGDTGTVTRTAVESDDSERPGLCTVCGAIEVEMGDGPDGPWRECMNGHRNGRENTGFSIGSARFEAGDEYDDLDE